MRFSICLPTHQRLEMLRGALESALAQVCDDFEVIVSDNASTDGTREFLSALKNPRLRTIFQTTNVGSVANHNRCVAQARGTWIVFLHDDDRLSRTALVELAEFFANAPDVDVALPPYMARLFQGDLVRNCVRLLNGVSMSSTVYRRRLLVEHPFHEDNVCCDWEVLFHSAWLGFRFDVYPREYVLRGHHPDQEGNAVVLDGRGLQGKANAVSRLWRLLGKTGWYSFCDSVCREWSEKELMTLARYAHHGSSRAAYRCLSAAMRRSRKWNWRSRSALLIVAETMFGRRLTSWLTRALKT